MVSSVVVGVCVVCGKLSAHVCKLGAALTSLEFLCQGYRDWIYGDFTVLLKRRTWAATPAG